MAFLDSETTSNGITIASKLNGSIVTADTTSIVTATNDNDINPNVGNGHISNGHTTNGYATNSYATNSHITNNHTINSHVDNSNATNGYATNGHSVNGHIDDAIKSNDGMMPIAICGMALRLPGNLASPAEMWEFLLNKGDARGRVPESRYNVSTFHSTTGKPGSVATEYGFFLDERVDLGALDSSFFSMPRPEVERADPQQRLLLEVARECFDDAGVTDWKGKTIGCYVGSFGEDWVDMFTKETQPSGNFRVIGSGDFAISNRLSYEFDLRGPR